MPRVLPQLPQRLQGRAQRRDRPVHEVPREHDHVWLQPNGYVDCGLELAAADGGAHVQVRQLHDAEAVHVTR